MKKITAFLAILVLICTLSGCRGEEDAPTGVLQMPAAQTQQEQNENQQQSQEQTVQTAPQSSDKVTQQEGNDTSVSNTPTSQPSASDKQQTPETPETPASGSENADSKGDSSEYALDKEVRFFGRTYEASGIYWFDMTLSGFEFSFNGTGAEAVLCTESNGPDHTAFIKVYVDSGKGTSMAVTEDMQTVTLAKGLKKGNHTIRVVKRTNARSSSVGLYSLTLIKGGTKLTPPAAKARKMEFIGDSLTVGYGALATSSTAKWSTATEDGTQTFAALTAQYFNAEAQVVAVSGRGMVHNVDGNSDKLLPQLFEYADLYHSTQKWNFSSYQPDVVVINAGANDKITTQAEMKTAMGNFIKTVRSKYKNAYIVLAYRPSSNDFTATYRELVKGQSKVSFVSLPTLSAEQKALGHPNLAGHKVWAQTLEKHIESLGIWK